MRLCDCCHGRTHALARSHPLRSEKAAFSPSDSSGPVEEVELRGGSRPRTENLATAGERVAYEALVGGFPGFSVSSLPRLFELAEQHDPNQVTHVIYHKDCLDGITAAWAAWKTLGDEAEYLAMDYPSPLPELPSDAVP